MKILTVFIFNRVTRAKKIAFNYVGKINEKLKSKILQIDAKSVVIGEIINYATLNDATVNLIEISEFSVSSFLI